MRLPHCRDPSSPSTRNQPKSTTATHRNSVDSVGTVAIHYCSLYGREDWLTF